MVTKPDNPSGEHVAPGVVNNNLDFAGADGGKTAHYMLRWESTRGEPGPWSDTASATIGA